MGRQNGKTSLCAELFRLVEDVESGVVALVGVVDAVGIGIIDKSGGIVGSSFFGLAVRPAV